MSSKETTFLVLIIITLIPTFLLIWNYYVRKDEDVELFSWFGISIVLLIGWLMIGIVTPLGDEVSNKYCKNNIVKSKNKIYVELLWSDDIKTITFTDT